MSYDECSNTLPCPESSQSGDYGDADEDNPKPKLVFVGRASKEQLISARRFSSSRLL